MRSQRHEEALFAGRHRGSHQNLLGNTSSQSSFAFMSWGDKIKLDSIKLKPVLGAHWARLRYQDQVPQTLSKLEGSTLVATKAGRLLSALG